MKKSKKKVNGSANGKSKFKHALLALLIAANAYAWTHKTDQYIFDRVLKLSGDAGSCSAEQIRTDSGNDYVLTAAHCREIVERGGVLTDEYGNHFKAKIIAEDPKSDLLLLAPIPNLKGLPIADSAGERQEIRTFTYGKGYRAYKTEGVLIQDKVLNIPIFDIDSEASLKECLSMPKYTLGFSWSPECILTVAETMSTAFVVPGSSGGAVVDSSGAIVGVVSAGGEGFSAFVRLADIQAFLADR